MVENLFLYAGVFVATYFFASIPWGYIIGRFKGIDIREHGSGNIGATNVRRVLGKNLGRLCFVFDFLKGLLPVLIIKLLISRDIIPETAPLVLAVAGFATVAGHVWTIYLKFKGGKGIATTFGVLLALAPLSLVAAGIIWLLVFFTSRYVSLASIAAAISLPLTAWGFSTFKVFQLPTSIIVLMLILAVLAVLRHSTNIKRLLNGSENRFSRKSEKEIDSETDDEKKETDESNSTQ